MHQFGRRQSSLRSFHQIELTGPFLAALVSALYALIAVAISTALDAPIIDEPIYAESAFEFARTGRVSISGLSAPNAVFDTVWGGWFAGTFGSTYGALRISSVVLFAISGPFMFWLCRTVGAGRHVSLVGTATYLFGPLAFSLSTTFHTDPHATALIVMALATTAAGLSRERPSWRLLLVGSAFISLAFLSRPQSLIVAIAAVAALFLWMRQEERFASWELVSIVMVPLLAIWLHSRWTTVVGEPFIRELSRQSLFTRGLGSASGLFAFASLMFYPYIGLFVLPLVPILSRADRAKPRTARVAGATAAALAIAAVILGSSPLDNQTWVSITGLAGVDRSVLGSRPSLLPSALAWLGVLTLTWAGYRLLSAKAISNGYPARLVHSFLLLGLVGFSFATILSSLALQHQIFDRYWLPVVPIAIALAAGKVRADARRWRMAASVALAAFLAAFSILGTRDAFVLYGEINDVANQAIANGIEATHFDGGASWSASTFGLNDATADHVLHRRGPFWTKFYAVDSDPHVGISLSLMDDYEVVSTHEYDSVLHVGRTFFHIVAREPRTGFYLRVSDF